MPGIQTIIKTKSAGQLVYLTNGVGSWNQGPKSSITGERIEGAFLNTSFAKPKLKAEPSFAAALVELAGEVSTEARVRKAFETLKAKHQGAKEAPAPSPKKAKATASSKRTPKQAKLPTEQELDRARFEAAMQVIEDLRQKMAVKAA